MTLEIESLMLFALGSQSAYSGTLRLDTTLEKKVFKKLVVSCSVPTTSPLSIKVILPDDTILCQRNDFIFFQKVLSSDTFLYLNYCNNFFLSFLQVIHSSFFVLNTYFCFLCSGLLNIYS